MTWGPQATEAPLKTKTTTISQTFVDGKGFDKTEKTFVCEYCDAEVKHRHQGAIFIGNVNAVKNGEDAGGLIGNNFPRQSAFCFQDVGRHVVCRACVDRILWEETP